jgi:hypothetical protein
MIVSIFKKVTETTNPFNRDVFFCLDRIKSGKSKDLVEVIRSLPTKDDQKPYKLQLPGVCFNGTFTKRSINGIDKRSGLIILDFDNMSCMAEAIQFKSEIIKDQYIFSAWISPSGKGVKALVKIPTDGDHKGYFNALCNYFDSQFWDNSGSNIDRFCYESYDPELYINNDSIQWSKIEEPELEDIGSIDVVVPIKSDNRIIENLVKWWDKKYGMVEGQKNNNLFKLAIAFNDFGINKSECQNILLRYDEGGKENEINKIINSAYKRTAQFGTKFFEDNETKNKIEKQVRSGKKTKDIAKSFPEFNESEIESVVDAIKETGNIEDFWIYTKQNKIQLSIHQFKFWLQQNNFYKYFPSNSNTYSFIKKEQNLVEETNEKRIKDFVLNSLLQRTEIGYQPYDLMAGSTKYFSPEFLSMLDTTDIDMLEDTSDKCYLYYNNCTVEITKDKIVEHEYIDIDGYVWKKQIIDRKFTKNDHHGSEFRKFLWLISGKDSNKYNSFKSVIGYLMHSFKTSANNKAIIFNDQTISENPNGGSGKGLFWNALAKLKKVASIDGKTFEFTKSFPYQTVSTDTQLLVFDDVKKNFVFENLFSLITEGITLEYKGQDAVKLPVQKSPKIIITTNYTLGGVGGSHDRRKFEVEMSDYFGHHKSPLDEFGHMLFDDWSDDQWMMFDNFMIRCCQFYLKNGLVSHDFNNLESRKFIKETSYEFYEWSNDDNLPINTRLYKDELFNNFINEYTDWQKMSKRRFTSWLTIYGANYGFKIYEGKTNNLRWIEFEKDGTPKPPEDVWDNIEVKTETPF